MFTGASPGKITQKYLWLFFFKFLLWNTVFSIGSRKQYAVPREEEPKWKWRAIVTSCFIAVCQYAITKNEEIGTTVDSKIQRKTTKQFLSPHPKPKFIPHSSSTHVFTMFFCNANAQIQKDRTVTAGRTCPLPPTCHPNPSSHNSSEWDFVTICSVLLVRPLISPCLH